LKMRENFYFYFSIFSLLFIFILIYFFYEMDYQLSNFIDVKTILTVLGTVFGAYFGAKTAGKFAIASVEKQIESNNNKEAEKSKKTIKIIMMEVYTLRTYLEMFLESKNEKGSELRKLYSLLEDLVKKRAVKLDNTMNKVDWMYIPENEFIMMTIIKELVNNLFIDIDYIQNNTSLEDEEEDFLIFWKTTERWNEEVKELKKIETRLKQY